MEIVSVHLVNSSEYDFDNYGIAYNSRDSFVFIGPNIHNRNSDHILKVWDNTVRLNVGPLYGPDAPGSMNYGKVGPGKYVDPHRSGTDDVYSYTWSPQPVVIMSKAYGDAFRQGPKRSEAVLRIGSVVRLIGPDGHDYGTFTCEAKSLNNPHLVSTTD